MKTIFRVEICATDDSCQEFWSCYPLSPFYERRSDAESKLKEFETYTQSQLEEAADVLYVSNNRPTIEEYELF